MRQSTLSLRLLATSRPRARSYVDARSTRCVPSPPPTPTDDVEHVLDCAGARFVKNGDGKSKSLPNFVRDRRSQERIWTNFMQVDQPYPVEKWTMFP